MTNETYTGAQTSLPTLRASQCSGSGWVRRTDQPDRGRAGETGVGSAFVYLVGSYRQGRSLPGLSGSHRSSEDNMHELVIKARKEELPYPAEPKRQEGKPVVSW